ncbi:MAG: hypothetical protein IJZ39_03885 [Oscillospiraceae bacterium]|nr:hypothetical protein [Oscillospiraceae bacterium]
MKKHAAKLLAVLLVLAMALTMTACGSDHDKIVGVWETEVEFADVFNNTLGNAENAEYLKVDSLKLKMILTFAADDTYSMVADPASVEAAMDGLKESLWAGMERYLVDTIAATGLNLEIGDILEMLNTNMDALIGDVLTPELIAEVTQIMAAEGRYLAEEGRLYLTDSVDKEVNENIYETYILNEDALTLVRPSTTDPYTELLYPLEFTRVLE